MLSIAACVAVCLPLVLAQYSNQSQQPISDPGTTGPQLQIAHLYYDEWPTGIAVSKSGRMFSNYPPALDKNDQQYTIAEIFPNNTEIPYPSAEINSPPGGRINMTNFPPTGACTPDYLVGSQSVVIDPADRLWILDTGRAAAPNGNGTMAPACYGGPKLVGVDLNSNQVFTTIVFDPTAAPATSYLNDVRFDLNPSLTQSGQGVAYITDSSSDGQPGIIIVDLGSGEAWRHLTGIPAVSPTEGFVPTVWGQPIYNNGTAMPYITNVNFGADGIALSADGSTLFFKTTGGRSFWSIPTAALRNRSPTSELAARAALSYLGESGLTDGMETDSNGIIYAGNIEDNSISMYDQSTGTFQTFVRDPRFSWTDTMAVGFDGYLYFTENQLWRSPSYQGGVELRVKPYVLFKVQLPNGGTKVTQNAASSHSSVRAVWT